MMGQKHQDDPLLRQRGFVSHTKCRKIQYEDHTVYLKLGTVTYTKEIVIIR